MKENYHYKDAKMRFNLLMSSEKKRRVNYMHHK